MSRPSGKGIEDPGFFRKTDFRTARDYGPLRYNESRIMDCYLSVREGDDAHLFSVLPNDQPGRMQVNLVGYAVVPLEVWNRQCDLAEEGAAHIARNVIHRAEAKLSPAPLPNRPSLLSRVARRLRRIRASKL